MQFVTNLLKKLNTPPVLFKVTDTNLEEIRASYPGIFIFLRKRCPVCQSYLVSGTMRLNSKLQHTLDTLLVSAPTARPIQWMILGCRIMIILPLRLCPIC